MAPSKDRNNQTNKGTGKSNDERKQKAEDATEPNPPTRPRPEERASLEQFPDAALMNEVADTTKSLLNLDKSDDDALEFMDHHGLFGGGWFVEEDDSIVFKPAYLDIYEPIANPRQCFYPNPDYSDVKRASAQSNRGNGSAMSFVDGKLHFGHDTFGKIASGSFRKRVGYKKDFSSRTESSRRIQQNHWLYRFNFEGVKYTEGFQKAIGRLAPRVCDPRQQGYETSHRYQHRILTIVKDLHETYGDVFLAGATFGTTASGHYQSEEREHDDYQMQQKRFNAEVAGADPHTGTQAGAKLKTGQDQSFKGKQKQHLEQSQISRKGGSPYLTLLSADPFREVTSLLDDEHRMIVENNIPKAIQVKLVEAVQVWPPLKEQASSTASPDLAVFRRRAAHGDWEPLGLSNDSKTVALVRAHEFGYMNGHVPMITSDEEGIEWDKETIDVKSKSTSLLKKAPEKVIGVPKPMKAEPAVKQKHYHALSSEFQVTTRTKEQKWPTIALIHEDYLKKEAERQELTGKWVELGKDNIWGKSILSVYSVCCCDECPGTVATNLLHVHGIFCGVNKADHDFYWTLNSDKVELVKEDTQTVAQTTSSTSSINHPPRLSIDTTQQRLTLPSSGDQTPSIPSSLASPMAHSAPAQSTSDLLRSPLSPPISIPHLGRTHPGRTQSMVSDGMVLSDRLAGLGLQANLLGLHDNESPFLATPSTSALSPPGIPWSRDSGRIPSSPYAPELVRSASQPIPQTPDQGPRFSSDPRTPALDASHRDGVNDAGTSPTSTNPTWSHRGSISGRGRLYSTSSSPCPGPRGSGAVVTPVMSNERVEYWRQETTVLRSYDTPQSKNPSMQDSPIMSCSWNGTGEAFKGRRSQEE